MWAYKLSVVKPQESSRAEQTVLVRLMESQIWHLPAVSVSLWGEGSQKGQWSLPTFLSGRKLSPSSHLDSRHFSSYPFATSDFQAVTPDAETERE